MKKVPKEVYDAVKERDKRCALCGRSDRPFHLHHVTLRSQGGKHTTDNCLMLCYVCHEKVHSRPNKYTHLLKRYLDVMNNKL